MPNCPWEEQESFQPWGKILMLWSISETLPGGAQGEGAHSRRRKQSQAGWRSESPLQRTWSAWRSKAKQGGGCGIKEQSPSLKHDAVGNAGRGEPAKASSLNPTPNITLTQESSP